MRVTVTAVQQERALSRLRANYPKQSMHADVACCGALPLKVYPAKAKLPVS
jgi:hypothetical protein